MAYREDIRNRNNLRIGWVQDDGSMLRAYHLSKGAVGWYNKGTDITFDKSGRIYCYGNGTCCLIRDVDRGYL